MAKRTCSFFVLLALGSELIKAGGQAVFKNCPNIKIVADLVGQWSELAAQTAVLQQLSTNPTAIDGVWQQGSMFIGVIRALQQAGRPIVPVTVGNPNQNSLAYWHDNVSKGFKTAGTSNAPGAGMELVFRTAMRVMMGQGLKVSGVVVRPPLITIQVLGGGSPTPLESTVNSGTRGRGQHDIYVVD